MHPLTRCLSLGALLVQDLTACGSACKSACENVAKVCAQSFAESKVVLNVNDCADRCDANLDGCKNLDESRDCAAQAKTCEEYRSCPACLQ